MSAPAAAGARTRNRRGEGARLRGDILAAATSLLDEHGTEEAVTLRAVARQAGITAPSIYRHFADRQAILLGVVQDAFRDLASTLEAASGAVRGADESPAVSRLVAVCQAYLDFADQQPKVYRLMFGGVWNAEQAVDDGSLTAQDASSLGTRALELLRGCLEDCVEAGRSTSTDPHGDAVALWLGLHGLASQRVASPAFPWPDGIEQRLVTSLARLAAAPAT